ncbi:uncharacterized protein LOC109796333 [Cajanus cajan]|uniref:uncharacterized protein LOC109796333 n=1 Tax=Cajanus cajan TaxID=3821 RepID=UPI00098D83F0|nr:uncharacterized protein LOC109796333 [Cajanus cajan]
MHNIRDLERPQNQISEKEWPRIFKIKRDLMNLKQGDLTITQYYTKVKSYWEELAEFQPPNTCTCGGIKPWIDHHNMDQVILFLTRLNDSYSHVRGQILLMDPIPPMNQFFSLVSQEKTQREIGVDHPLQESNPAFTLKAQDKYKHNQKERPYCEECKKYRNTKDTCFKIHGYPAHFKKRTSNAPTFTAKPVLNQVARDEENPFQFTAQQYQQLLALL